MVFENVEQSNFKLYTNSQYYISGSYNCLKIVYPLDAINSHACNCLCNLQEKILFL